jgi:hypothetical protein
MAAIVVGEQERRTGARTAKHAQAIELVPTDGGYMFAGEWNLLGDSEVVAGTATPRTHSGYHSGWTWSYPANSATSRSFRLTAYPEFRRVY